jgi:5-methylcytosine-specific restriction endonuclease McrA
MPALRKMTNKRLDGIQIWKEFEDLLIPKLRLSMSDRAVYSHLLRHSRLEGKRLLRFSIGWLARGTGLGTTAARRGVRRLTAKGALRLAERSKRGHVIEVRLPEEVRRVRARRAAQGEAERLRGAAANLEETDFLEKRELREAIHAREGGHCFYCLRRVTAATRCLDHIVPQVRMGRNGYRNLVSSCSECNSLKGDRRAEDFLRWLYREGRLESGELKERLRALGKMAAGKMRPALL